MNGFVMLAAGGTGGHLFPAEALARELLALNARVALVTDRRGKAFGESLPAVPVHRVSAATLEPGLLGKLRTIAALAIGTWEARRLIKQHKPDVVVGFGGYPSLPAVMAARLMGVPVVLHEQNAVLGRANRLMVRGARKLAISFPIVSGLPDSCRDLVVRTGNPVRPGVAAVRDAFYTPPNGVGPIRLLVMGGSQGARVFSEVIPAALALLPETLRARLMISQQCRPEDIDGARAAYEGLGVGGVELQSFFHDVPNRLVGAHLVVCRAGASTMSELTAVGRPGLLVPYPFATDDHQTENARSLAAAGGAWLMPQPDVALENLAHRLEALLRNPADLALAAAVSRGWCVCDAAQRLAETVIEVACGPGPQANCNCDLAREAVE
ncbi:MAG: undecaprenyldiphospho-muramoylpentapeptide beta-N-acetylglucosaminyltransferase [Rhodospirillaceae bacterium]